MSDDEKDKKNGVVVEFEDEDSEEDDDDAVASFVISDSDHVSIEDFKNSLKSMEFKDVITKMAEEDYEKKISDAEEIFKKHSYGNDNIEVQKMLENSEIPVLPLRDTVTFPNLILPLLVGRVQSINAIEKAKELDRKIFVVAQKNGDKENISHSDLYNVGTVVSINQIVKLPDGTLKLLASGLHLAQVVEYKSGDKYISAKISKIEISKGDVDFTQAMMRRIKISLRDYYKLNKSVSSEYLSDLNLSDDMYKNLINHIDDEEMVLNTFVSYLSCSIKERQRYLEMKTISEKAKFVDNFLSKEIVILRSLQGIDSQVTSQLRSIQRDNYLRERLRAIKSELGERGESDVIEAKYNKMKKTKKFSDEAKQKIEDEIVKLSSTSSISSESSLSKSYLDVVLDLPWGVFSKENHNIGQAIDILDSRHYRMAKVKERITEHIAQYIRTKQSSGTVLCLWGPPGVGKTTLVRSIAKCLGRNFAQISLGGVKDESEIRGHRRTYVGAMPGKIIKAFLSSKSSNPVILLDEIDKISSDYRGDPASALLEVLDPEQNKLFKDHYLDLDYDLSNVMFVCTANSLDMPSPLRDRMELIKVSSYLEQEKVEICKNHIINKKHTEIGLQKEEFSIDDEAIRGIIRYYTRESGVRDLERYISKLMRQVLLVKIKYENIGEFLIKKIKTLSKDDLFSENLESILKSSGVDISKIKLPDDVDLKSESKDYVIKMVNEVINQVKNFKTSININNLKEYLGVFKYLDDDVLKSNLVGVVNGLAYTEVGGDVLLIEAVKIEKGKGDVVLTGKLGDVMKESSQVAMSHIKSKAEHYGANIENIKSFDVHIHVPEGAVPKDGPSAGITIATSIISLFLGIPVRKDVAMTGEITLRGEVLAIGGLREKMVAAISRGIKKVIIPKGNQKDLEEIPDFIKQNLEIIPCSNFDEVIKIALDR